jgi:hypothetical protein
MKTLLTLLVLAAALLTGCAHVPPESVTLSRTIGEGITENHRAYDALINRWFDQKRDAVDRWIEHDYTSLYLATVRVKFNTNAFDEPLTADILQRITRKRDALQADLEKSRQTLLDRVDSNHALLVQANTRLTALLQSAVDVAAARAVLTGSLTNAGGGRIDFAALDQKFNAYLQRTGDLAEKTAGLYDELQSTLNQ